MFSLGKKDKTGEEESHIEEFIPYACHFDPDTVITKNGELMQVIKITGFDFETVEDRDDHHIISVREAVRNALKDAIDSNNIALWIHTIRRKQDLRSEAVFPENFSKEMNKAWSKKNRLSTQFINELYITVLIEGEAFSAKNPASFMRSLVYPVEIKHRQHMLDERHKKLTNVTNTILQRLQRFSARRLGLEQDEDGAFYTQIGAFLGKVMNLRETPIPLAAVDLSEQLPSPDIQFGYNKIEVDIDKKPYFGAMLSVKEYHEVMVEYIDAFLQLPEEFIITESFDFINHKKASERYQKQYNYLKMSEDTDVLEASGILSLVENEEDSPTAYGEHQISVMMLAEDPNLLEVRVIKTIEKFRELGFVVVREDMFMEDCYWASLPGNFTFLHRLSTIHSQYIGGFASLYNFPAGKRLGNKWGEYVALFRTNEGNPYFFNFHYDNNGHTLVIGPYGSGKTSLINFLVSEAQKYAPQTFYLDVNHSAEILINALDGHYERVERVSERQTLRYNPLHIADNKDNRIFLYRWLKLLIMPDATKIAAEDDAKIKQLVTKLFEMPPEKRRLRHVLPKFWPLAENEAPASAAELQAARRGKAKKTYSTAEIVAVWYGKGDYAHLFDNEQDELKLATRDTIGFDITHMIQDDVPQDPMVFYLMHQILTAADPSRPTLVVVDESFKVFNNPVFQEHKVFLRLNDGNGVMICAEEHPDRVLNSQIAPWMIERAKTQIYLPNAELTDAQAGAMHLTDAEAHQIRNYDVSTRQFTLKHNVDAVTVSLDLSGMPYELAVLAPGEAHGALMQRCKEEKGEKLNEWLPAFKEYVCNE